MKRFTQINVFLTLAICMLTTSALSQRPCEEVATTRDAKIKQLKESMLANQARWTQLYKEYKEFGFNDEKKILRRFLDTAKDLPLYPVDLDEWVAAQVDNDYQGAGKPTEMAATIHFYGQYVELRKALIEDPKVPNAQKNELQANEFSNLISKAKENYALGFPFDRKEILDQIVKLDRETDYGVDQLILQVFELKEQVQFTTAELVEFTDALSGSTKEKTRQLAKERRKQLKPA